MTAQQITAFLPMSFSFTGLDNLSISSEDYLWEGAGVPGVYCLGIQQMGMFSKTKSVYDRQQEAVGFRPLSSCPN